jgi:hypothetical protein
MKEVIECPNCRLINPPKAQVCDCGTILSSVRGSESSAVAHLSAQNRTAWNKRAAAATAVAVMVVLLLIKFARTIFETFGN